MGRALKATVTSWKGSVVIPIVCSKDVYVPFKALVLVQFSLPSTKAKVSPNTPLDISKGPPLFSTVYVWVGSLPKRKKKKKRIQEQGIHRNKPEGFGVVW